MSLRCKISIPIPPFSLELDLIDIDPRRLLDGLRGLKCDNEEAKSLRKLRGKRIQLRSSRQKFVCADRDRGGELVANRIAASRWETFELFGLPDGKVALRGSQYHFVSANLDIDGRLVENSPTISGWEAFTLCPFPDGKVALRAFNEKFVMADFNRDGQLIANRPEPSGWEAFDLILR